MTTNAPTGRELEALLEKARRAGVAVRIAMPEAVADEIGGLLRDMVAAIERLAQRSVREGEPSAVLAVLNRVVLAATAVGREQEKRYFALTETGKPGKDDLERCDHELRVHLDNLTGLLGLRSAPPGEPAPESET